MVRAQSTLGGPLPGLTNLETTMFNAGLVPFTKKWDPQQGLGPVYTQLACSSCHLAPAFGGNSPNKQTFFGTFDSNGIFDPLTSQGGIQLQNQTVSRFKPNCVLSGEVVPSNATVIAKHLSPQLYGLGLVDNVSDNDIIAQAVDKGSGVHGIPNNVLDENGNLRVGHFGYKAEFADLLQTVGLALQHDIGITNPIAPNDDLPNGQPIPPFCSTLTESDPGGTQMVDTYHFIVYLAPNTPGTGDATGQALFSSVGCALCHLPTYTTQANVSVPVTYIPLTTITSPALSSQPVNLYSDLLLHDMNGPLQDGLTFYQATSTYFRTTPLWGISSRLTDNNGLMHDGSAKTIPAAIAKHFGEAATVVANYNALSVDDQNHLIAFVSSL